MVTLSWRLLDLAGRVVDRSVDLACRALEGVASRIRTVTTTARGETISREEAAREILRVPDEEWDKGRVIELSRYRRAGR